MSSRSDQGPRRKIGLRRHILNRFTKNRDGVVAIEFAFIAAPFFGVLLGIIEAGLFVFASQLVESAMADTARLIRTGQAQGMTRTQLLNDACGRVIIVPQQTCVNTAKLEVQVYQDFSNFNPANLPLDGQGQFLPDGNIPFQNSFGGDIVVARLFYPWPMFMPNMGIGAGQMVDGSRLIVGVAAFRNEPF